MLGVLVYLCFILLIFSYNGNALIPLITHARSGLAQGEVRTILSTFGGLKSSNADDTGEIEIGEMDNFKSSFIYTW